MKEIKFRSKWFERCVRKYIEKPEGVITEEDLKEIKYFAVETTHSCQVEFGKDNLPKDFEFPDAGDEWDCCCISNTGKYKTTDEFIDVINWGKFKVLRIKEEALKECEQWQEENDETDKTAKEIYMETKERRAAMKAFMNGIQVYYAKQSDYDEATEDEDECNLGLVYPEDFSYFSNVCVLRLKTCEQDVHSLAFLKNLPQLKILEIGEVRLTDLEGLDKLTGLDYLTIWSN